MGGAARRPARPGTPDERHTLAESTRHAPTRLYNTSFLHLLRHRRHSDQPAEGFWRAAGLPDDVTVHHLRHTAGQLLTDAGTPENVVAALLGHSPSTITRHYAPPTVAAMRPYVEAVYGALAAEVERLRAGA